MLWNKIHEDLSKLAKHAVPPPPSVCVWTGKSGFDITFTVKEEPPIKASSCTIKSDVGVSAACEGRLEDFRVPQRI